MTSQTNAAIQLEDLTKVYRSYRKQEGIWGSLKGFLHREYLSVSALQPTSLSIAKGTTVGLVGSNGAGKTTLLKLLSGLVHPTGGTAEVLGFVPWRREFAYLRRISILLGQKNQLWWDLAPVDSFRLLASIYDFQWKTIEKRFKELAEMLQCVPMLQIQLRRLSLGERMKMELIGALLHQPEVLFLDEPTIGLDVVAQTTIREFLKSYSATYRPTIILTSHYMDDIAQLADRLLILTRGSIVYDGTVVEFINRTGRRQKLTVVLDRPLDAALDVGIEGMILPAGNEIVQVELEPAQVPLVLAVIGQGRTMREIKTDAVDFEDVMRQFFAASSVAPNTSATP